MREEEKPKMTTKLLSWVIAWIRITPAEIQGEEEGKSRVGGSVENWFYTS